MIRPIVQEKLLFPEILWNLPQNIQKRRGKVFVVAGNLRSGISTVEGTQSFRVSVLKLGLPEGTVNLGKKFMPEDLAVPLPESREGTLSLRAADLILENTKDAQVTVVGGGMTRNPETGQLIKKIIPEIKSALILFSDALFSINLSDLSKRTKPTVVLADAGELGRVLVGSGYQKHKPRTIVEHIYQHRFEVLSEASTVAGAIIVLYGPDTAIASPDSKVVLEKTQIERPEVCAGVLAGILVQNRTKPFEAAATALHIFRKARQKAPGILPEIANILSELEKEN